MENENKAGDGQELLRRINDYCKFIHATDVEFVRYLNSIGRPPDDPISEKALVRAAHRHIGRLLAVVTAQYRDRDNCSI